MPDHVDARITHRTDMRNEVAARSPSAARFLPASFSIFSTPACNTSRGIFGQLAGRSVREGQK